MTEHDKQKLQGVHPELAMRIGRVMAAMDAFGHPMMITDGIRTDAEQQALYAQGRTRVGPDASNTRPLGRTVTNADGVIRKSNHQPKADGMGRAVDCTFVVDGKPSWDARLPWDAYGALVQAADLDWGGAWKTRVDRPHAELTTL